MHGVFRSKHFRRLVILAVIAGACAYPAWRWAQARHVAPWRHYHAAQKALQGRDFAQAYEDLAACLKAWPDDAGVRFQTSRAARRAGLLDLAEEHFLACTRLLEKQADANPGDMKLEWALLKAQRGELPGVEDHLRARLRDDHPDSLLILEALSWQLMMSGRLGEAQECLAAWLKREPDNYDALVRRGWVAEHRFNYPEALESYQQALAVDSKQDFVRLRIVEILLQRNRSPEARADLELLDRHQPDNPAVLVCWARYHRLQGDAVEARKVVERLLTARPRDPEALCERALLAMDAGQTADAESLFRTALAADPSNRQINYSLSLCLERLGKKDEAIKLRGTLAQLDAERKKIDRLTREAMKRPHDPGLRYEVGMIFLRNGFTQDGLRWLTSALKENPSHQPSRAALADYYERTGDPERAGRHRSFLEHNASQTVNRAPGRNP